MTRLIACFLALLAMTFQASHSFAHPHIHTAVSVDHAAHDNCDHAPAIGSSLHRDCVAGAPIAAELAPACALVFDVASSGGVDIEQLDCCAGHCCAPAITRAGGEDPLILVYSSHIGVLSHDLSFAGALAHPPRRPPKHL